jgi:hypothetical protein
MAHFAELDDNNVVIRVIVINNNDCLDANGTEVEQIGIDFCSHLLGGKWIQTSYNNNIRKNFAGIGFTYDASRDAFIAPKPESFPSLILDEETCRWVPPVPRPGDNYEWNENLVAWQPIGEVNP